MDPINNTSSSGERPVFGGWIDLGPAHGSAGCGSEGTTAVPDRIGDLDLRAACDAHDACSEPLSQRHDGSFGELVDCQALFAHEILAAGDDSKAGRFGAALVAAPYVTAVSVVAAGHWTVSRVLDAGDAVAAGVRQLSDLIRGR